MKTYIGLILFLSLSIHGFTQDSGKPIIKKDSCESLKTIPFSMQNGNKSFSISGKSRVSMSTGAGFSVFNKQNIFSTWVAPEISYSLTPRFHLTLGLMMMHCNINSFTRSLNGENIFPIMHDFTQYFLFAQGSYLLNEKVTLTGSTMHNFTGMFSNPYPSSVSSVGLNIKFSDSFSIGAACSVSKGVNNIGVQNYNPFHQQVFPFIQY